MKSDAELHIRLRQSSHIPCRRRAITHSAHSSELSRALLLRSISLGFLVTFVVTGLLTTALPLAAQETTEEVAQNEEVLCEEEPAAQGLGEAIANEAIAQANALDLITGGAGLPALQPDIDERQLMSYLDTFTARQKLPNGLKVAGHHLVDSRHIRNWGQAAGKTAVEIETEVLNAPSVLVYTGGKDTEHYIIHEHINSKLPCDGSYYGKDTVWDKYQEIYRESPRLLDAIQKYIYETLPSKGF